MADGTNIEWTDATWNPVTGCSVVSPGCTNCYAMKLAGTRLKHHPSREGLTRDTKAGPVWTGEVKLNEEWLAQPLRWRRSRRIFVCAHADLFHEKVPDEWIDRIFAVMALSRQHTFQVLTKRPARMRAYCDRYDAAHDDNCADFIAQAARSVGSTLMMCREARERVLADWPLPNVWLGVSVEDQKRADERRADFEAVPAAVKFVSYEPALGPVDWTGWEFVQQIISGGENGPRPSHPDWHRAARDFCARHGIAYFFKQWGSWGIDDAPPPLLPDPALAVRQGRISIYPDGTWMGRGFFPEGARRLVHMRRVGKKAAGHLLDGVEHRAVPGARLRVELRQSGGQIAEVIGRMK